MHISLIQESLEFKTVFAQPELPSFIFDPYSDDLDLDQLELIAAKFYEIDDIGSYKEYIEKTFSGSISAEDN